MIPDFHKAIVAYLKDIGNIGAAKASGISVLDLKG